MKYQENVIYEDENEKLPPIMCSEKRQMQSKKEINTQEWENANKNSKRK